MSPGGVWAGPADETFPGGVRARALAESLLAVGGGKVRAVLLFGSHLAGTAPSRFSAFDFVVLVDAYRPFYDALVQAGHHRRPAALLAGLARVLAPNVVAFAPESSNGDMAKIMTLTPADFRRALSPGSPDHFVKGRMAQRVAVLWARSEEVRDAVRAELARGRSDVLRWAGPALPPVFDGATLARTMLEVSYGGEVRPEAADRAGAVYEAQRPFLDQAYRRVLAEAEEEGVVARVEGGWRFVRRPGRWEALRTRWYFLRSKLRSTARWFKYMITFDEWLTYVQRKVERRTGMSVELTPLERRWPLVFLWPKAVRVLRARPATGSTRYDDEGGSAPEADTPGEAP